MTGLIKEKISVQNIEISAREKVLRVRIKSEEAIYFLD
jgi:hypothetical protein